MKLRIFYLAFILGGFSFGQNQIMIPYVKNSKWGFSDVDKKILITPQYDSVRFFESAIINQKEISFALVFLNNRIGVIDKQNKSLLPIQYLDLEKISDTDFFIAKNEQNKFGLISLTSTVLPFEFESIKSIRNNSFLVKKNNKIGVVDFQGKIVIPVIYDQINFVDEDETKQTCRWRVSNEKETKYVFTPIQNTPDVYSSVAELVDSSSSIKDNTSKVNQQSKDFDIKIPINYEPNLFITRKNNLYGFLNEELNVGFLPKFEKLKFLTTYFDKNYKPIYFLTFEKDDKKGLTNQTGTVLLPAQYDEVKNRYKFIEFELEDKKGVFFPFTNRYVDAKFDSIKECLELSDYFQLVLVSENNKSYYVGENGNAFTE